jgi:hypothetical protein
LGDKVSENVIEDVPFEYAFPVLTGWDIAIGCGDEHVTEIGVRIDTLSYLPPAENGGTLSYRVRSLFRDKNGRPGHEISHRVSILGFVPTTGRSPDVEILEPASGVAFGAGVTVRLAANALDPEEGNLPGSRIRWFSSVDGFLGTGQQLEVTLSGSPECESSVEHELRAAATDSDGNRSTARINVFVVRVC